MPTYDYVCAACGHEFEHFQKMSDGVKRKCPECGELKLKRLMGIGAGIIFKGSGFYETDYKRKSRGGKAGTGSNAPAAESESRTESGSESGSESKKTDSKKGGGTKAAAD